MLNWELRSRPETSPSISFLSFFHNGPYKSSSLQLPVQTYTNFHSCAKHGRYKSRKRKRGNKANTFYSLVQILYIKYTYRLFESEMPRQLPPMYVIRLRYGSVVTALTPIPKKRAGYIERAELDEKVDDRVVDIAPHVRRNSRFVWKTRKFRERVCVYRTLQETLVSFIVFNSFFVKYLVTRSILSVKFVCINGMTTNVRINESSWQ